MLRQGGEPLIYPNSSGELIIPIFTRECHLEKFINDPDAPDDLSSQKVSMIQIFLGFYFDSDFSFHINPTESEGLFEIEIPQQAVDTIYNLATHTEAELTQLCADTGKSIHEGRI
jgi:hypothetical protein